MNKNSTHLSRQKKIIIILAVLAIILAAVYYVTKFFHHEELQTVYKLDKDGDEVYAIITDTSGVDRGINTLYLNNVLEGTAQNKYNVKKGTSDDILYTFEANDIKISYYPMIFPEVTSEALDYVKVTNTHGSFKVYTDPANGTPVIEQAKDNLYNSAQLSELLFQSRYMLSNKKLSSPSKNIADYGLSPAQKPITIEVCDKKGNINTVYMGSKTPDGGYYMKHKDKPYIYIMDSSCSIFENDMYYYLNPIITRALSPDYAMYITSLSYHKDGKELFTCEIIPDDQRVGALKNQLHRIVSPENKTQDVLSTTTLYNMFTDLCTLSGVYVLRHDVSKSEAYDEIMVKYGFDNPSAVIEYTFGETAYFAMFGNSFVDEASGEEFYYAYSPYMDTVVLAPLTNAPFLKYEYIDFVHNKMFQHNIDDVAKITLTDNSGSRVFVTSGSGKELSVTEQTSGKQIHVPSFRQFYIALVSAGVDGYSELESGVNTESLEHNLTFEIELKSGELLRYAFYSESTLRCYTVINGVGEYYTKREYVDRIATFADMLMNGEEIESQI